MRLRKVPPESHCRQFFGRDRLDRLERIVGIKTIASHFLLDLIVRQQGPQLLAERPRRIGAETTSIRKALLKSLSDDFGRFREPQAWEYFWKEWNDPDSTDVGEMFRGLGWDVIAAPPES